MFFCAVAHTSAPVSSVDPQHQQTHGHGLRACWYLCTFASFTLSTAISVQHENTPQRESSTEGRKTRLGRNLTVATYSYVLQGTLKPTRASSERKIANVWCVSSSSLVLFIGVGDGAVGDRRDKAEKTKGVLVASGSFLSPPARPPHDLFNTCRDHPGKETTNHPQHT